MELNAEMTQEFKEQTLSFILGALSFAASLAWNDFFQTWFQEFFPKASQLHAQLLYAVLLTFVSVCMLMYIRKRKE